MSAPRIILDCLPSFCYKLSDLVEVWHSYNKNNFACFFLSDLYYHLRSTETILFDREHWSWNFYLRLKVTSHISLSCTISEIKRLKPIGWKSLSQLLISGCHTRCSTLDVHCLCFRICLLTREVERSEALFAGIFESCVWGRSVSLVKIQIYGVFAQLFSAFPSVHQTENITSPIYP